MQLTHCRAHLLALFLACSAMATAQTVRSFTLSNSSDGGSTLTVYLPEHPNGRAILDCPGGGYQHLAMDHEGHQWAPFFNRQGIAYAVLKYRMPDGDRNKPLDDAYRAMRTLRDSAQAWHVNPLDVGIMGFSAGGHLASSVSTHAEWSVRPNFSILFYPVVTMERGTHQGSKTHFLGQDINNKTIVKAWSNERQVRCHLTPPAAIFLANDDRVVPPVQNGVAYYKAMREHGNNCALYIYPTGGHGFGFRTTYAYHDQMLNDLTQWLKLLPAPKQGAKRVACIGNSITDGSGIDMCDTKGYPAQLQALLGGNYLVKNFGVSARTLLNKGDFPYMNEEAWHDALAFLPDIVIVKLGTNDSKPGNWAHGGDFRHDLMQLTDSLKALPTHPRILLCSPIPALKPSWGINDSIIVQGITPIIKEVAKKQKAEYIDLHSSFSTNGMYQADGIHPNEKGAGQLAALVGKAINTGATEKGRKRK